MKKAKAVKIISWLFVAVCMGVIFFLSSQTADESSLLSDEIKSLFGLKAGIFLIRKCAHFLEFTGLSVLIFNALYRTCGHFKPIMTFLLTSAYAVSDEIHQIFVEGRACRFNIKEQLRNKYNVSLFARPKNMKNFYEKIMEVATKVTSFKDVKEGKEIKNLA